MEQTEAAVSGALGAGVEGGDKTARKALKVVAAVDASEESLHALSWALDNVVRCHPDATLVVVHAQHAADHFAYPVAAHGIGTGTTGPRVRSPRPPFLLLAAYWAEI
jgi:hypothetical protein